MGEDVIEEIVDLYDSAQVEFRTTKEKEYWQGRKDGLRLALALLQPDEKVWNILNKSSGGFRIEEKEQYRKFLEDIYYNVCDMVYSIRHKEKNKWYDFIQRPKLDRFIYANGKDRICN